MKDLTNYFLLKQFYLFQDKDFFDLNQIGGKNNKKRWDQLFHNGPLFPDEYQPHKTPILFKNEKVELPSDAEEYATIYSKYLDTEYIKNKKFNKNFWNDWKKYIKSTKITNLEDCDFSLIQKYVIEQKEKKLLLPSSEKQKI